MDADLQPSCPITLIIKYFCGDQKNLPRGTLAVERSLLSRLYSFSRAENKSVYALTNDIVDWALRIFEQGDSLQSATDELQTRKIIKEIGLVPVPTTMVEQLVCRAYAANKSGLLEEWYQMGHRLSNYFKIYGQNIEDIKDLATKTFWTLTKLDILEDRGQLVMCSVGMGTTQEFTECWAAALAGFARGYGYRKNQADVSPGVARLRFQLDSF